MKQEVTYPLVPGKAIGVQRGFASTFNWMRNFCLNLTGGPGVTVDRTDSDHPIIRLAAAEQTGIAPFTVRLHKTDGDQTGLWEIYLPNGCCNVGGICEPLNPPASDTSGHKDDDPAWRSLGRIDFDAFAYEDNSAPTIHAVVEIHVKPSVKVYGVDRVDNAASRLVVWAGVRDQVYAEYVATTPSAWREARTHCHKPGDVFAADVASITGSKESANGKWKHSIDQLRSTALDAALPQGTGVSNFDLVWVLKPEQWSGTTGNRGLRPVVKMLLCVRQLAAAAGIAVTGDTMTDVVSNADFFQADYAKIYARVNVTDLTSGAGIVQVLKDPVGVDISTPYVVWLPLYDMMYNVVVADYRAQSLVNLQLFHA